MRFATGVPCQMRICSAINLVTISCIVASVLIGCTPSYIRYDPGSDAEVNNITEILQSKANAAAALQTVIRASDLQIRGDNLEHRGYLGPVTQPPNLAPSWSPESRAIVTPRKIIARWQQQHVTPLPPSFSQGDVSGIVRRWRDDGVSVGTAEVAFAEVGAIYYVPYKHNGWNGVPKRRWLHPPRHTDGYVVIAVRKDQFTDALDDLPPADVLFVLTYSWRHEELPLALDEFRDWTDGDQPEEYRLATVLAALEILCFPEDEMPRN